MSTPAVASRGRSTLPLSCRNRDQSAPHRSGLDRAVHRSGCVLGASVPLFLSLASAAPRIVARACLGQRAVMIVVPVLQRVGAFMFAWLPGEGIGPQERRDFISPLTNSLTSSIVLTASGRVMAIRALIQQHSFAPEDITRLVTAFEEALGALGLANRDDPATMLVAHKIIELATQGERDPIRLRDAVVKALSVDGSGEAR
jgi:hypothetical protein